MLNFDFISFQTKEISDHIVDNVEKPKNDFHTSLQFVYLNDKLENIRKYARGVAELSFPDGIELDLSDINDSSSSSSVEHDESQNFDNSFVVSNVNSKKILLKNVKLDHDLYWRVVHEGKRCPVHHLKTTKRGPRNLFIEGVTNVRDVGGYVSSLVQFGTICQGLYLRGAKLDDISENGKNELIRLGVKTEIDLRDYYMCNGPYVDGIEYHAIPIPSRTEEIRFERFESEYEKIFNLISNADKKPVYLHCSVGADRTGIVTFILLVVCGVSYEDTARDYLFTNFQLAARGTSRASVFTGGKTGLV